MIYKKLPSFHFIFSIDLLSVNMISEIILTKKCIHWQFCLSLRENDDEPHTKLKIARRKFPSICK